MSTSLMRYTLNAVEMYKALLYYSSTCTSTCVFIPCAQAKYGHSLTESAVGLCPELRLIKKPTANAVRALKRKRDRQVRDQENTITAKIIRQQILGSSTAFVSSYLRKRQEQSFVRPKQPGKVKSHSPSNHTHWDIPSAMAMLQNWQADTRINWSAEAQRLGISGANCGQVLKEAAQAHGIDTVALDGRSSQRLCARKRRLPGSDISVGCGPSKKTLQNTWAKMVRSG